MADIAINDNQHAVPAYAGAAGGISMFRKKRLFGVLLAAFMVAAISGVASSSASAVVFTLTKVACSGGTFKGLCYELESKAACVTGSQLCELEGEQSELVVSETEILFAVPSIPVEILCKSLTGSGTIQQPTPLTANALILGTITFEGCVLEGTNEIAEKCVVAVNNTTKELEGELTSATKVLLKPESPATAFIGILFSNKAGQTCPILVSGEKTVTGQEELTVLTAETPEKTKLAESVVKSELKFLGKPAELTGELELAFEDMSGGSKLGDLVDTSAVL